MLKCTARVQVRNWLSSCKIPGTLANRVSAFIPPVERKFQVRFSQVHRVHPSQLGLWLLFCDLFDPTLASFCTGREILQCNLYREIMGNPKWIKMDQNNCRPTELLNYLQNSWPMWTGLAKAYPSPVSRVPPRDTLGVTWRMLTRRAAQMKVDF